MIPSESIKIHSKLWAKGQKRFKKSEVYLDFDVSMQQELEDLRDDIDSRLDRWMVSHKNSKFEEIDGQYLVQLSEIAKDLAWADRYSQSSLQKLVKLRWQLDSIKRGFEGSVNLKFKLEKLMIIWNSKLKEHKRRREWDFESMRNSILSAGRYTGKDLIAQ